MLVRRDACGSTEIMSCYRKPPAYHLNPGHPQCDYQTDVPNSFEPLFTASILEIGQILLRKSFCFLVPYIPTPEDSRNEALSRHPIDDRFLLKKLPREWHAAHRGES